MHIDGQAIAAFSIVGVAAYVVVRRIVGQLSAFRSTAKSGGCGGCDGCGPAKPKPEPQLVQLQTRPPMRIRGPKS
jgi:hypothetical protein